MDGGRDVGYLCHDRTWRWKLLRKMAWMKLMLSALRWLHGGGSHIRMTGNQHFISWLCRGWTEDRVELNTCCSQCQVKKKKTINKIFRNIRGRIFKIKIKISPDPHSPTSFKDRFIIKRFRFILMWLVFTHINSTTTTKKTLLFWRQKSHDPASLILSTIWRLVVLRVWVKRAYECATKTFKHNHSASKMCLFALKPNTRTEEIQ